MFKRIPSLAAVLVPVFTVAALWLLPQSATSTEPPADEVVTAMKARSSEKPSADPAEPNPQSGAKVADSGKSRARASAKATASSSASAAPGRGCRAESSASAEARSGKEHAHDEDSDVDQAATGDCRAGARSSAAAKAGRKDR